MISTAVHHTAFQTHPISIYFIKTPRQPLKKSMSDNVDGAISQHFPWKRIKTVFHLHLQLLNAYRATERCGLWLHRLPVFPVSPLLRRIQACFPRVRNLFLNTPTPSGWKNRDRGGLTPLSGALRAEQGPAGPAAGLGGGVCAVAFCQRD